MQEGTENSTSSQPDLYRYNGQTRVSSALQLVNLEMRNFHTVGSEQNKHVAERCLNNAICPRGSDILVPSQKHHHCLILCIEWHH